MQFNLNGQGINENGPQHPLLEYEVMSINQLSSALDAGHLFAVLDACGCDEILTRVVNLPPDQARCLYLESPFQEHWAVAPYLVRLDLPQLSWIIEKVWHEPWGILAVSTQGLLRLFDHLRRILIVKGPDGRRWYFRFYDPRVLDAFLPTCNAKQLADIFGPISRLGIKGAQPGSFSFIRRNLYAQETDLATSSPFGEIDLSPPDTPGLYQGAK